MKELVGLPLATMQGWLVDAGYPAFRAKQLFDYIYKRQIFHFEDMTQFPVAMREWLATHAHITIPTILEEKRTPDGDTIKLLVALSDGSRIETVLMKQAYGHSVCVSSQVGCAMGCIFCASTQKGRLRNLEVHEIVGQLLLFRALLKEELHSMVVMGAGEPMENYDNVIQALRFIHEKNTFNMGYRRMTVSTCGLPDGIRRLAAEGMPITLALSLHAPTDSLRQEIMPIANRYPLSEVLDAVKFYFEETGRKITFEYILIDKRNASLQDADTLASLLRDQKPCTINLIPVNGNEHINLIKPSRKKMQEFVARLEKQGYTVVIRKEMGDSIQAACGQLKADYENR